MLSTGGGNSAVILAWALDDDGIILSNHLQGAVFDCLPMSQDLWRGYKSLVFPLANYSLPVKVIGHTFALTGITVFHYLAKLGVLYNMAKFRKVLNEPRCFGGPESRVKRLYLWSEQDEVTDWRVVESHAEEAEKMGLLVEKFKFKRGHHCALPLENGENYWRPIRRLWEGDARSTSGDTTHQQVNGFQDEIALPGKPTDSSVVPKQPERFIIRSKL
jgi:hypothetical protein